MGSSRRFSSASRLDGLLHGDVLPCADCDVGSLRGQSQDEPAVLSFPVIRKCGQRRDRSIRRLADAALGSWWKACCWVIEEFNGIDLHFRGDDVPYDEDAIIIMNHTVSQRHRPCMLSRVKCLTWLTDQVLCSPLPSSVRFAVHTRLDVPWCPTYWLL